MAELSLLVEEFPDEAKSSMLCTLRLKLERELAASVERNAQARRRQQALQEHVDMVSPHTGGTASSADTPTHAGPAAATPVQDSRLQERLQPGNAQPDLQALQSTGGAAVDETAPCRQFRGV